MRKFIIFAFVAIMFAACNKPEGKMTNDELRIPLSFTTEQAACMSAIACNEAKGDLVALESAIHNGLEAGMTVSQIKEALSQLYAYTGFPRSLNALGVLQNVVERQKAKELFWARTQARFPMTLMHSKKVRACRPN